MTRQEAIKKLQERKAEYLDKWVDYGGIEEAYDMAIEALEQEPRWISVKEKLPEESHAVLVYCPERKNIYCACYEEKQWWIVGSCWDRVTSEILAWMPLPKAYKAESEE